MGGLIPLLLKPAAAGSRGSVIFPINRAPSPSAPITTPQPVATSPTMATSSVGPPKARVHKRSASQPAPLPVLPYTSAEWSKAVSEVKRQYINRKYRPCSLRCCEILDNIKESANVEPAYLIYLHFYAASSFDMLSRPLQCASPYRTRLLQQAREHYTRASELSKAADETMARSSRPSSAATSSMHSPSSSTSSHASSRTWTNSTAFSSPTPSVCSVEDAMNKLSATQPPPKKRVTFCDVPEEPFIRPDSPTLGFDDFLCAPPQPEPPRYLPVLQEEPEPADEPAEEVAKPTTPEPLNEDCDAFDFLQERSIHRYCGLLSSLRSQIAVHISNVEEQLAAPRQSDTGRHSLPARAATPELSDELRNLDIKARIERLRQNNWQRRRFDIGRYEALRESVLAELE